jgi:major cell surface glycoprotein (TIGR04216 family)
MNSKAGAGTVLTLLMVLSVLAVAPAAAATITSASGGQVQPGNTVTVSVSASDVGSIDIGNIPSSWSVASSTESTGNAFFGPSGQGDNINSNGNVAWAWGSDQSSVSASVTLNVPSGASTGTVTLDVNAGAGGSASDSTTVDVDVTSGGGGTPTPPPTTGTSVRGAGGTGNPADSTGTVGPGAVVFQGEEDIDYVNGITAPLTGIPNQGADGEQLDSPPISQTQQTGVYEDQDGDRLTVQTPRIQKFEIVNVNGEELGGSAQIQEDQTVLVVAEWNFEQAEDVELTIEDDNGLEVQQGSFGPGTVAALSNGQANYLSAEGGVPTGALNAAQQGVGATNTGPNQVAAWHVDLEELEAGSFTFEVAGIEDLDFGEAVETATIEVTSSDDPELELESDEATQGDRVEFSIENSEAGAEHWVGIELQDARDGITDAEAADIFRFVGDTQQTGTADLGTGAVLDTAGDTDDAYALAQLEVDDDSGVARGQVDTAFLDDTSVDITLWDDASTLGAAPPNGLTDATNEVDEVTLDVLEADIELLNPGATYVPGQEVDVNGTASSGMDAVDVYVRDQGDWYLLTADIDVESDGTFEEEDQLLSDFGGSNQAVTQQAASILSIPGIYRIGVVDRTDSQSRNSLNSSAFNSGTSVQRSIRVALPTLTATFETYNGEIFVDDGIDYEGKSIGPNEVVMLFTSEKGDVIAEDEDVDDDDEFDREQFDLSGLSEGRVLATALSTGRDGEFGDGVLEGGSALCNVPGFPGYPDPAAAPPCATNSAPPATVNNFITGANARSGQGKTLSQLVEIFRDQTIEDEGSDDLLVSKTFRLTDDSTTGISDVVPAAQPNASGVNPIEVGETTLVRGLTNRNPEVSTIVVEAINGTDANKVPVNTTEEWGTSGEWNMTLDIPTDVTPGTYTLQAEDGDTTDSVVVDIVAQGERGNISTGTTQQLQNQIQELQGQVQQLRSRNQQLNQTVSDLRSENQDLQDQMDQMEQNDTGGDTNDTAGDEGQPGFTPVVALIALVSAALIALRRR